MFKASSTNKTGKAIFYTFEISALIVGILLFILAIYNASISGKFMVFLQGLTTTVFCALVLYALGKICDLLFSKKDIGQNQQ